VSYLVSYTYFPAPGQLGFGHCHVSLPSPMTWDNIQTILKELAVRVMVEPGKVTILSFSQLAGDSPASDPHSLMTTLKQEF
jgi:hypothetical protein